MTLLLLGCSTPEEKEKKKLDQEKKDLAKKEQPLKDQAEDPTFIAFLGRLRMAVARKDRATLAGMMTTDFGYRWDNPPVGDNVFTYWDLNNSWPELRRILNEPFAAHDRYMVAPAAVALDSAYGGFRAGIRMDRGGWRFAYFVPAEEGAPQ